VVFYFKDVKARKLKALEAANKMESWG